MRLDHVLIGVDDLDSATKTYEGLLGLPAAVRSDHPTYGTRNALFIFERGPYLELLGLQPNAAQAGFSTALIGFLKERGPGLYGVALAPDDLDAAVQRVRADGIEVADPARGTGVSADGRVREWRNTRLPAAALHNSFSLMIEHMGWDWRTDLKKPPLPGREASAVRRIDHVVFAVTDGDAASAMWERRFGVPRAETIPMPAGGAVIGVHPLGDTNLEVIGPTDPNGRIGRMVAEGGDRFIGLSVEVPDLDAAVAAIRALAAEVTDPETGILPRTRIARVSPASAYGVPLQLLQRLG